MRLSGSLRSGGPWELFRDVFYPAVFFIILIPCCFYSCIGPQVKYSDPIEALYDNYWIDDNTLQIQVEYTSPENMPYTMRKEKACNKAKELIDTHLYTLYPSIQGMSYRKYIYKTMYHNKTDCRLIVHIAMENLRNKLIVK